MTRWICEPGHTGAEFIARHMMVTDVRGYFKNIEGSLEFDPSNPSKASIELSVDSSSFSTEEKERDEHLRGADFLDVSNHPKITFKSTKVEMTGATEGKIAGDLTIRGITKPVTFDVRYQGQAKTPFNDTRIGFRAKTTINRHDFGVDWNSEMEEGGVVVSNEVKIILDVEAIKQ